jgi:hypothetical protein
MTYTWADSSRYCSTEIHATSSTCPDCTNIGACAGCGRKIADGSEHKICIQNGEPAHSGCTGQAAAGWVDYY